MPCVHGRSSRNVEKIADRRSRSASKRSIIQSNYKECQVPELALGNFPHRWYICTIIFLPHNENWKALPVLPLLQGTDPRNQSESGATSDMDGLESIPPRPQTFTEFDLRNQSTDSAKMILCTSSLANISEESETTDKANLSNDSPSTSLSKCLVSCDSSSSVNDDFSPIGSNFLVDDARKANKTVKRNSRKKGKKKGKQSKKASPKKISTESDVYHDEGSSNTSFFEDSMKNFLSSTGNQVSNDKTVPTNCLVRNSTAEKDDIRNDNSSTMLVSCTSCSDQMDKSESTDSLQRFASDNKSITIQAQEIVPSNSDNNYKDVQRKDDSSLCHSSCSIGVSGFSSSVVDSSLDGWNGDISENCSDDMEIGLTSREEDRPNSSEVEVISGSGKFDSSFSTMTINLSNVDSVMSSNGQIGNPYRSSNVFNACSTTDRTECSSQACSSNGFQPVLSGKRSRRARKMTASGKSEGANRLAVVNPNGRPGRDNVCSVWQKVQKIDTEKPSSRPSNHVIASTRDDQTSKQKMKLDTSVQLKEKAGKNYTWPCSDEPNKATSQMVSSAIKSGQPVVKCAAGNHANNVKNKFSSVSEKANHSFRSDFCADDQKTAKPQKYHVNQKETLQPLSLVNDTKVISTKLGSQISIQPVLVNRTDHIDDCQSELEQETDISSEEVISPNIVSSTAGDKNLQAECSSSGQLPRDFDLFDEKSIEINLESNGSSLCSMDMHAVPIQYSEDSLFTNSESENSFTKSSNVLNSTAVSLQKSIHLERRHSVVKDMGNVNSSQMDVVNEAIVDKSGPKNAEADECCFLSLSVDGSTCSRPSSRGTELSSFESVESNTSFKSHRNSADEIHGLSNYQTFQVKGQEVYGFVTDLHKIRRSVLDAYKLQTATENTQSVTRTSITDVEKFLYSASPVILHKYHSRSCKACPREELIGHSLCWHQISNIPLRSLWYWYEEPGCFGLEVKAQDHCHSKDFRNGSSFNAYFVPYLSAVQLFAKSSTGYQDPEVEEAMPSDDTSTPVSYLGSRPNFSVLLPLPKQKNGGCQEFPSSAQDEFVDQSANTNAGDGELIFEYFESEQPPWRRPLCEKIKELVSGQTSPSSRIFGDPQKLESMNLQDLHPASWYCVAWYPIYRIPDGNFRAAFLTYHSLGCFVHGSFSSSDPHSHRPIVSPVVGLQTYNVKGESWFQLKNSDSKPVDPSQLTKERMRALKETATVMATAVVSKSGQRSVNHHPDFQFFQSRASRGSFIPS